jgi:peptidyl-prolyl cis-trans isomerase B (cyclophilin B)
MNFLRKAIIGLAIAVAAAGTTATSLTAGEVAVFTFQVGKSKEFQTVAIELDASSAPGTVENFKTLVRKKFYKGQHIHRVAPDYLVQLGDPESEDLESRNIGTNGPGYTLPPEIRAKHAVGSVAMARLPDDINPGRRSNGSQFYISLAPMPELDGKYTVFGKVVSGLEFLQSISRGSKDTNDMPTEPVKVRSVKIEVQ